ncbi:MAG: multifunctional oxoglutarate decarboxylase/oxoglutarate dehydrogenase thiamine pyrophosphate-binding subunit/dihydrolipoyllysine-residue succinyltransferase subunit [Candidatus Dormibacteria bacterium]
MPETVRLTLPAMGESVTEGTVVRWVKQPGDRVTEGETLVEVTTDKVDIEVPAPASGTLAEITAPEGETVPVGGTLGLIAAGPSAAAPAPSTAVETPAPPLAPAAAAAPPARAPAPEPEPASRAALERPTPAGPAPAATPEPPPSATAGPAPAPQPTPSLSPLARRRAALTGAGVVALRGSGPGGVVRRADLDGGGAAPAGPHGGVPATGTAVPVAGEVATPIRGPHAALVEAMERSRDIPTATSIRTIPVGLLDTRRRQLNAALGRSPAGLKVSYTHLIGYALARAAAETPGMLVHFARDADGRPLRVEGGVHLGLAVDTRRRDGARFLVVPVLRDAGSRDFAGFRAEYERLVEGARTGSLTPDELQGASLTLTNPGGIGTVASVPRLMPGQGCIIAAGAIGHPPEFRGESETRLRDLGVGRVVTLTSTYDHRVIQGAESGEFLGRLEALLAGADGFYGEVFESLGLPAPEADEIPAGMPAIALHVPAVPERERVLLLAVQAATSLVKAHRTHGHLGAHLDPLGTPPPGDPAMRPETYNLTPELMARIPADVLDVHVPGRTLAEVLPNLRRTYCGTVAYEIEHISSHEQRDWLREKIESGAYRQPLSTVEELRLLWRLTKVDAMERYFRRAFIGQKTFSGEGVDMLVPMLEKLLGLVADDGITEVVMGMPHRGRLAVIAHVVNRPYEQLLQSFEKGELRLDDPTGDVKYHLGATGTYVTDRDRQIEVRLVSNPSHLEAVDGVVEGWTRALQSRREGAALELDPEAAIPILIHGDAAFSGQGVVQEVLNLQSLAGYTTGGTVHVIIDNQLGFTTDPADLRSTRYASDLAKGFDIPIVHVNADDPEGCVAAARFAHDYRRTHHRDVVIHLVGYRRFGHNETDEPSYTQPLMYQRIREHPTVRELFVRRLIQEGLITDDEAKQESDQVTARIADAHRRIKANLTTLIDEDTSGGRGAAGTEEEAAPPTRVAAAELSAINESLFRVPDGFTVNPKLARQLERRHAALEQGGIDWGHAEALALGSLLRDGVPIRLTGQDTERGTFSHRQMVLHDDQTGAAWAPIQHLEGSRATFEVHNSPLSEVGALAFEYGYSAADPRCLVLWEAQFGDFANNAQMVVDQFIVAAQAKWGQRSRLVLLLPHGYEGQGPEHSSARMERFLQLAADGNIRVASCSNSAQYFHLLRDQALAPLPQPLVCITPKSLLRAAETGCAAADLTDGGFLPVIEDPRMAGRREDVRVLLLCTGKIFWELEAHELREPAGDLAIGRVDLLDPLPLDEILGMIRSYPNLERLYWVQEEPENMGAWAHVQRRIGRNRPYEVSWEYIGRPRRASPSEGYHGSHVIEQGRVLREALTTSPAVQGFVAGSRPRLSEPGPAPSTGPGGGGAPVEAPRRATATRSRNR